MNLETLNAWLSGGQDGEQGRNVLILHVDSGFEANAMRGETIVQTSWSGHDDVDSALQELNDRLETVGEDIDG